MKTIYTNCLDLSWKMSKYLFSQTWLLFENRMEKKKLLCANPLLSLQGNRKKKMKEGKRINWSIRSDQLMIDPHFSFPPERERNHFSPLIYFPDWLTVISKTGLLIGLSSTQGFEGLKECKGENFTGTCVSPFELGPLQSRSVIINCKL